MTGGIGFAISARVTIEPPRPLVAANGSFVASADQLDAWVHAAKEGDRCIYARVTRLPRGSGGVGEMARNLAAAGAVTLTQPRHAPASPLFDYIAKRSCAPILAVAPPPVDEDELTPAARRVYDLCCRRADQGAPLESNRGIARATGLRDADAAAYQLRRLAELGLIIRSTVPVEPFRTVTIVETGARTGLVGREARR